MLREDKVWWVDEPKIGATGRANPKVSGLVKKSETGKASTGMVGSGAFHSSWSWLARCPSLRGFIPRSRLFERVRGIGETSGARRSSLEAAWEFGTCSGPSFRSSLTIQRPSSAAAGRTLGQSPERPTCPRPLSRPSQAALG